MEDRQSSHKIELFDNKPEFFYTKRFRKKKGKGVRTIHAPSPELKKIQKEFADWFYRKKKRIFDENPQITGFMPGKSIADNALPHLNKDWVVNLDIKDFFPSTDTLKVQTIINEIAKNRHWIKKLLRPSSTGFKGLDIHTLMKVLSLNGGLPQGSPASPILANYTAIDIVDKVVAEVCGFMTLEDVNFTRYADDITVSFNRGKEGRQLAEDLIRQITGRLSHASYKIKEQKTVIRHRSQRQLVTGVLVNGDNTRIDKRLMNKMRAIIHNSRRDGEEFSAETKGMLSFIQSINKEQYNKLIN